MPNTTDVVVDDEMIYPVPGTEARTNPQLGTPLIFQLGDKRWNSSNGWTKMQVTGNGGENVHYVYNPSTGQVDDFKFKRH